MDSAFPQRPSFVKYGPYTYDDYGVTVASIPRASSSILNTLFPVKPVTAPSRRPVKRWIAAQLQHFGIPYEPSNTVAQLLALLEKEYRDGHCKYDSPSVLLLEKTLYDMYQAVQEDYQQQKADWRVKKFARQVTPSDEALFDPSLFMAKYFLNKEDGVPDKSKQSKAIVLHNVYNQQFVSIALSIAGLSFQISHPATVIGWAESFEEGLDAGFASLADKHIKEYVPTFEANFDYRRFLKKYFLSLDYPFEMGVPAHDRTLEPVQLMPQLYFDVREKLRKAVANINGLLIATTPGRGGTWTLLTWSEHAEKLTGVVAKIHAAGMNEKLYDDTIIAQVWQTKLSRHNLFKQLVNPNNITPLRLGNLQGQYVIRCNVIDPWGYEDFSLDINAPRRNDPAARATFSLGKLQGAMILALDCDKVDQMRRVLDKKGTTQHDTPESDSDDDDDDWEKVPRLTVHRFRNDNVKWRVYLQYAGTCNGLNQVDEHNEQVGYIDFNVDPERSDDDEKAVGYGLAYGRGYIVGPKYMTSRRSEKGEMLPIEVFKWTGETVRVAAPWNAFNFWGGFEARFRVCERAMTMTKGYEL
ncbi:similar to An11g04300 [Aspergillus luchuensis IFO 4308]|nr:similar to An11g04300 [Aspergillus luchuensis IFO 4308]